MGFQRRKGTVAVLEIRGRLRLQWTWAKSIGGDGKRYWVSLELDANDAINRSQAELRAKTIEADLKGGTFDPTLDRYKPKSAPSQNLVLLFERFMTFKGLSMNPLSLEKYRILRGHLSLFFGDDLLVQNLTPKDCADFRGWLLDRQSPATARERLGLLSAAIDWEPTLGRERNPCRDIYANFKLTPIQEAEPFSVAEAQKIMKAFDEDSVYRFYGDFVRWLFGTGCRFGEGAALQWRHLSSDCTEVWIGESIGREKVRKGTKTNRARRFALTPELAEMLLARRPENVEPNGLVFPSRKSDSVSISDRTFHRNAWKVCIKKAGIVYRKPYNTRHTFVSLSLLAGMNPLEVCAITGHRKETMFSYYARFVGVPVVRSLYG
jgi:integrase